MVTKRRAGIVEYVTYGTEDHGLLTCYLGIDFGGCHQAFGGLALDETTGLIFTTEVCKLFGVTDIQNVKGRKCFALWCLGDHNETIEGIETLEGRFTVTGFQRLLHLRGLRTSPVFSRLHNERNRMQDEVIRLRRQADELENRLDGLSERWTEWETAP